MRHLGCAQCNLRLAIEMIFRYSYLPGTKPQITSLSLSNAAGFEVDVNHPTTVPVHCSRKGPVSGHYVPRR